MGVAAAPRLGAGHERGLGLVDEHREGALEERDVDPLSAARAPPPSHAPAPWLPPSAPRSRPSRPAISETAPKRPATTSLIATPTFIGRPSGSPVIDISPPTAWITKS